LESAAEGPGRAAGRAGQVRLVLPVGGQAPGPAFVSAAGLAGRLARSACPGQAGRAADLAVFLAPAACPDPAASPGQAGLAGGAAYPGPAGNHGPAGSPGPVLDGHLGRSATAHPDPAGRPGPEADPDLAAGLDPGQERTCHSAGFAGCSGPA